MMMIRPSRIGLAAFVAALATMLAAAAPAQVAEYPYPPGARFWSDPLHRDLKIAEPFAVEAVTAVDSILYRSLVTTNNKIAMTLTNYGFIGNNFISRAPSLEYPAGAGYEHLVRAGLWVGARSTFQSGLFTGVATGTTDGATSNASQGATEFTPAGNEFTRRSVLITDPFFKERRSAQNPTGSISEQDIISSYSDYPAKRAASNFEDHKPMGLLVTQENYSWSFSDFANMVFFHYKIKNLGPVLTNVWVGFYAEFASGNKAAYTNWAPSSADPSGTGSWFNRKQIAYDDSLRLFREHYCASLPIPEGCQYARAPHWIGLRLLGSRSMFGDNTVRSPTLQAWSWAPSSPFRGFDTQRYALMADSGFIHPLTGDSLQPQTGDPCNVLSIGPFPRILSDSVITVDFAIVGGATISEIQQNSRVAQRAYDLDYILPEPPPSPRLKIVARNQALDLYWDRSPEGIQDPTTPGMNKLDFEGYRVYVGEDREALHLVGAYDSNVAPGDTTGFNTGFDMVALQDSLELDGRFYHYKQTVTGLRNGFRYFAAVTAFDRGNNVIEPLESGQTQNLALAVPGPAAHEIPYIGPTVFPNPYRVEARWDQGDKVRDHYLWFTRLPRLCTLRIFTLSGDMLLEREFDGRTYRGDSARGLYNSLTDSPLAPPTLSGTTFAWDLITREGQAAATGLYLFSVEDHVTRKRTVGKFLIVKSDRE